VAALPCRHPEPTLPSFAESATSRQSELQGRYSGQSFERIERDADRDRGSTPEQAREYGLVDHVVASTGAPPPRDIPVAD
jgi:ATP-dependent protease ClpP protease subunit